MATTADEGAPPGGAWRDSPWLVGIGASAGGFSPLRTVVAALPADLPAAVFVLMHLSAASRSTLAAQLRHVALLPVRTALDGDPVRTGVIYVCPPDRHLLVEGGRTRVVLGPKENGHRPALDVLFRSMAAEAGPRALVTVLSGALDDGAAGALAVADAGGPVAVQDPDEALVSSMPRHALAVAAGATCLPSARLADWIVGVVTSAPPPPVPPDRPSAAASRGRVAATATSALDRRANGDDPPLELRRLPLDDGDVDDHELVFACPDCGGSLLLDDDGRLLHFRCRVGHRWSAAGLGGHQDDALERALWTGLRVIDEQSALDRRLLTRARQEGRHAAVTRLLARIEERADAADTLRAVIRSLTTRQAILADEADGGLPADVPEPDGEVGGVEPAVRP